MTPTTKRALSAFRKKGGILRTYEALEAGIHPRTLYAMRDAQIIEQNGRGLFRIANLPPLSEPDLVVVAKRIAPGSRGDRFQPSWVRGEIRG